MKEILRSQLALILAKYEKLGISTLGYETLKRNVTDEAWLSGTADIMAKISNSEKIFNISKEINEQKNDQRVDEAFAELDTARNLATTKFYGDFDRITYQPPKKNMRWPDLVAENTHNQSLAPVEVKLLTPQDLSETKFFQKFIDRINNHALPQLAGYYADDLFDRGYVFIWSYHPVELQNLSYDNLKEWLRSKAQQQPFNVTVLCNLYGRGMWDFYIDAVDDTQRQNQS